MANALFILSHFASTLYLSLLLALIYIYIYIYISQKYMYSSSKFVFEDVFVIKFVNMSLLIFFCQIGLSRQDGERQYSWSRPPPNRFLFSFFQKSNVILSKDDFCTGEKWSRPRTW